jgi:hypothetical protein
MVLIASITRAKVISSRVCPGHWIEAGRFSINRSSANLESDADRPNEVNWRTTPIPDNSLESASARAFDGEDPIDQSRSGAATQVDLVAELSGMLVRCLQTIASAAEKDENVDEGWKAVESLGETLSHAGRLIEGASSYWVSSPPVRLRGFAPCVCIPELILRLSWRAWNAATIVVGESVADLEIVMPDSGKWQIPNELKYRWALVRRLLLRLRLRNFDSLSAMLQIEFVGVRSLAIARLQQGAERAPHVHYLHRPCVEEWMRAVEMLPLGWAYLTADERLAGADRCLAVDPGTLWFDGSETSLWMPGSSTGERTTDFSRDSSPFKGGTDAADEESECSIRKLGHLWYVRFQREKKEFPVGGSKCLQWLMIVLMRPNHAFPINELLADPQGKLLAGVFFKPETETDQTGFLVLRRELDDINALIELGSTESLEKRKDDILARVRRAQEQCKLGGGDPAKKAHHNICTQIRKFTRKLRDSMPLLADHLSASLKLEFPSIGYFPPSGSPAWKN